MYFMNEHANGAINGAEKRKSCVVLCWPAPERNFKSARHQSALAISWKSCAECLSVSIQLIFLLIYLNISSQFFFLAIWDANADARVTRTKNTFFCSGCKRFSFENRQLANLCISCLHDHLLLCALPRELLNNKTSFAFPLLLLLLLLQRVVSVISFMPSCLTCRSFFAAAASFLLNNKIVNNSKIHKVMSR